MKNHVHIFYDCTYEDLDPGIVQTVRWVRSLGYNTVDSGDGSSKPVEEREFDYPHVLIMVKRDKMIECCDEIGAIIADIPPIYWDSCLESPSASVSYFAGDDHGFVMISYLNDDNLPSDSVISLTS